MKNICYKGEKPKYITGFPVKVEEGFYFEENEDKLDYTEWHVEQKRFINYEKVEFFKIELLFSLN